MATQERDALTGAVEQTKEKGKELASQAQQQAHEKTSELRSQAETRFREQVDVRSTQAGEQLSAVGQALRQSSERLRTEGKGTPAQAMEQAATKMDDLGSYLSSANADRILHDVESFARRRPWLTAAAGAAVGLVASRFLKASSERRYEGSQGYPQHERYPEYESTHGDRRTVTAGSM